MVRSVSWCASSSRCFQIKSNTEWYFYALSDRFIIRFTWSLHYRFTNVISSLRIYSWMSESLWSPFELFAWLKRPKTWTVLTVLNINNCFVFVFLSGYDEGKAAVINIVLPRHSTPSFSSRWRTNYKHLRLRFLLFCQWMYTWRRTAPY